MGRRLRVLAVSRGKIIQLAMSQDERNLTTVIFVSKESLHYWDDLGRSEEGRRWRVELEAEPV